MEHKITCETIFCAADIIAERGQSLLVLNGVVVGVAPTGGRAKPPAQAPASAKPPALPPSEFLRLPKCEISVMVLEALAEAPGMNSRQIGTGLALTRQDERNRLSAIIGWMKKEGFIVPNSADRFPGWILGKQG